MCATSAGRIAAAVLACSLLAPGLAAAAGGITTSMYIDVRISKALSSASATAGQAFEGATVKDAVVSGRTAVTAGTPVKGKVIYAKPDGVMRAPGILRLELTSVGGQTVKSNPVVWQGNDPGQSGMTDTLRRPTEKSTGEAVISPDAVLRFMVTRPDGPKFVPKHELSR